MSMYKDKIWDELIGLNSLQLAELVTALHSGSLSVYVPELLSWAEDYQLEVEDEEDAEFEAEWEAHLENYDMEAK